MLKTKCSQISGCTQIQQTNIYLEADDNRRGVLTVEFIKEGATMKPEVY
jgi:hypothetical protein